MNRPLAIGVAAVLVAGACARVESVDRPLPAFEVQTIDGALVSNADLRGKPTLINFWSPQ